MIKNLLKIAILIVSSTIAVSFAAAPTFTSTNTFSVAENTEIVGTITATVTTTASVSFAIDSTTGGADAALFLIDASNDTLIFSQAADFENPNSSINSNTYNVIVTATSDGVSSTQAITIDVTNVDDVPQNINITNSSIDENLSVREIGVLSASPTISTALTYTLKPTISDVNVILAEFDKIKALGTTNEDLFQYALENIGTDFGNFNFSFSGANGVSQKRQLRRALHTYTLIHTNNSIALSGAGYYTFSPKTTYYLGNDGNSLKSTKVFNYEELTTIDAKVNINDGNNNYSQNLTININNILEEAPTITSIDTFSVLENTTAVATLSATDDVGTVTFSTNISGADAALFTLTAAGVLTLNQAADYENPADNGADNIYNITVSSTNNISTTTQDISIDVTNVDDVPQQIILSNKASSIAENSAAATVIADLSSSPTITTTLTYTVNSVYFDISTTATGASLVLSATKLDYEALGSSITISINVSDGNNDYSQTFTFTIDNVTNEPPTITSTNTFSVFENTTAVATLSATNENGTAATFLTNISGTNATSFTLTAAGVLAFNTAPVYSTTDAAANIYNITISATNTFGTTAQDISINIITNPTFNFGTNTITLTENAANTIRHQVDITVVDEDNSGANASFAVSAAGGIFTANPAPVVSFSNSLIDSTAAVGSTPKAATLYFTIIPDATGAGTITITLTDEIGYTISKTITIIVSEVNKTPVITAEFDSRLENITVYGGHLYGIARDGGNATTKNNISPIIDSIESLTGATINLARFDSIEESNVIGDLSTDVLLIGLNTGATNANRDWFYDNNNEQFGSGIGGNFIGYPGYFINWDNNEPGNNENSAMIGFSSADDDRWQDVNANDNANNRLLGGLVELVTGFPALTQASFALNQESTLTQVVTLSGFDLDGDSITWSYSDTGNGTATFTNNSTTNAGVSSTTVAYQPAAGFIGTTTLNIILTDSNNNSATAVIDIAVLNTTLSANSINENAGANASVGIFSTAGISGVTYTYTLANTATFSISGDTLIANNSFDFETQSSYTITVTTTDEEGNAFSKDFIITIINDTNEPPAITSTNTFSVFENTTAVATLSATDENGTAATFLTNISGANAASFTLTAAGVLAFNTAPVFSTTDAAANIYNITISATNTFGTTAQDISINIITKPTFNLTATNITLTENSPETIRHQVNITEIIDNDNSSANASFAVSAAGGIFTTNPSPVISFSNTAITTSAILSSTPTTATLYFTITPDAIGTGSIVITLTDVNGYTSSKTIIVTVSEVNKAPVITAEFDSRLENITVYGGHLYGIARDGGNATNRDAISPIIDSIELTGATINLARFDSIEESNVIGDLSTDVLLIGLNTGATNANRDWFYDNNNEQFGSGIGGNFIGYPGYFINWDNNEPGNNENSAMIRFSSADNARWQDVNANDNANGRLLGGLVELVTGFPALTQASFALDQADALTQVVTLSGFDLDGDSITWSYSDSDSNGTVTLTNNSTTNAGVSSTTVAYQPAAGFIGTTTLSIILTDSNNNSATAVIDITVLNTTLSANSINENAGANAIVGIFSTVGISGVTYTYTLANTATFSISGDTLIANNSFDFETQSSYTITVTTTDGNNNTFSKDFVIDIINDTNEPPLITSTNTFSVFENTTAVATLSATDENGTATFLTNISGANAASFTLTAAGVLAFNTAPVYSTTDAAANIYNITISATNTFGTTAQDISINIITKPTFNLGTNTITLNENAANTIRHQVDITAIDKDNSGANASFAVSTAGGIFTTNPAPVVSFSNSSIMPTAAVGSTPKTATLYFTIIPDATGVGVITITLTDENSNVTSKTLTVTLTQADTAPVITAEFDSRIANVSVYGGHLYAYSAITANNENNNVYKIINTELGGHFAAIDSIEEQNFLNNAMPEGWEALVSTANVNNNAYPFNLVLETNTDSTPHSVVNSAGNYTIYPGLYDFTNWSTGGNTTSAVHPASEYVYGEALRKISSFLFGEKVSFGVRNSRHEFPNGFTALTQASSAFVQADALTQVATLSGFDLDGDSITWSYSDAGNGTATFTNNTANTGVSSTTVAYQPAAGFIGTTTLSIILTDSNNNSATAAIDITVLNTTLSSNSIKENAGANVPVGVLSTVGISAATYTYTLDNTAIFSISATNTLIANNSFDFETQSSYNISVTTTDEEGNAFVKDFIIDIIDELEKPVITSADTFIIFENTTAVATLSATDENGTATFSTNISGANATAFTLTAAGVLTFNTAPVYSTTDAAANIYNITISATNTFGITTQDISINIITKPTFNLGTNTITLTENSPETIRHQVDITEIIDRDNSTANARFTISSAGGIFTANPAPVVSFSNRSIDSTAVLSGTAQTATLYFTIIPDTTGTGSIVITLTDVNGYISSKTLTITLTQADTAPVITAKFDSRIANISVYGGHLYAYSAITANNENNNVYKIINTELGGHFAAINSIEEQNFLNNAMPADGWEALVSTANLSNHTYPFNVVLETNTDSTPHSVVNSAGNYTIYPGFYNFTNWSTGPNTTGVAHPASEYAYGATLRKISRFFFGEEVEFGVRNSRHEFPNGFTALTQASFALNQAAALTEVAKLSGFDLDGDSITWSYSDSAGNGMATFTNNSTTNAGISSTTVRYQPNSTFAGTTTLSIILTDSNNNSATLAINIDVVAVPELANQQTKTYAVNTQISPLSFVNTGGVSLTNCSSAPDLPVGLSVAPSANNASCEINGTPTATSTAMVYTIIATNIAGTDSATVSIAIEQLSSAPILENITVAQNYTTNYSISPLIFRNLGGLATFCTSPDLPVGLSAVVSNKTCAISGVPTQASSATYTITASNSFGSSTATVSIIVSLSAPDISLSASVATTIVETAIKNITVSNAGGEIVDYSIAPAIANGLSFSAETGTISGTPTVIYSATYTITATNLAGTDSAIVNIIVHPKAPNISLSTSTITAVVGVDITDITVSTNTGGAIVSYSINPPLGGVGLSFSTETGTISGAPTAFSSAIDYTITAINAGGSGSATLSITVLDNAPTNITLSNNNIDENAGANVIVGTFSTMDPDFGTHTYTLANTATFSISDDTLIANNSFDFEAQSLYNITVTTTDGDNNTFSKDFVIDIINDTNEPPLITSANTFSVLENTTIVATLSATVEVGTVTFSTEISGANAASFTLTADGALAFNTAPVFSTTDAAENIYNITISATNTFGTTTQDITINVITKLTFNITATDITLTENAANTIRHQVDVTAINDNNNSGNNASFAVSTAGGIFTANPAPVVSFSDSSIVSAAVLSSTAQTATLYFTVIPDVAGSGTITITLTGANNNVASKTLTVIVNQANKTPIISQDIATYIDTITDTISRKYDYEEDAAVFGGSLYFSLNNTNGADFSHFVALQPAFNTDAHIAIVDSEQERLFFNTLSGGSFDTYLGVASTTTGGISNWTSVLGDFILFDSAPTAANGEQYAPGRFNLTNTDNAGYFANGPSNSCLRYSFGISSANSFNDRPCNDVDGGGVDNGFFELPSGLPATTTLSATIDQDSSATEVAKLTGFDLDGDNITWSYTNSAGNGTATFTNNTANTGVSSTTVAYQPAAGSMGTTTLSIILTDSNNNSATLTININVDIVAAPKLENQQTQTYAVNIPITTPLRFTNTGGVKLTNCSSAPDLPVGLSVALSANNSTCEISGTPSVASTATIYTITATNIAGTDSATVEISVSQAASKPSIANIEGTQAYYASVMISTVEFTNSGDPAQSCASNLALPAGLNAVVSGNSCAISGTPTMVSAATTYTITATNLIGSDTATINISVTFATPSISVSTTTVVATARTAISDITVTNSGGTATYSISPTLSEGLSFSTETGTISGTPSAIATLQIYTITASNVTNSDSATLSITVNLEAPNISLSTTTITATARSAISNITVTNSGGDATYSISPAIANDLSFDTADGTISGTPANAATNVVYTVTATNVTNSDSATLSITVNPAAPIISLSVSTLTATAGTAISDITVTNSGGTATYSISPAIANNLSFDTTNGTISGTPANAATNVVYTVTATNATNSDSATLSITVNPAAPIISLSVSTLTATAGTAISNITVTNSGGTATYSISPAIANNLSFATATGTISGTPSATATLQIYTITASNVTNSDSATLSITVNIEAPNISLSTTTITATARSAISNITVTNSGGDATYSISPAIDNGLSFDTTDGTISGTPANAATNIVYIVTASNISGNSTATLDITVNPAAPNISLSTATIVASVATAITTITVSNDGGTPTSYAISRSLSAGLSFSTETGTISGIPTATATTTIYTITASNITNSDSATLSITVNPQAPIIVFSPATVTVVVGMYIDISATNTGGVADLYSIAPTINNNLSFSTETGVISGTPANAATNIVYIVTASNISGNSTATLDITVNPAAPNISLSTATIVASVATAITTITVSNDGGTPTSYAISRSLSAGLSFSTETGTISGIPTATATTTIYTITASNITNSDSATLSITVNPQAPIIVFSPATVTVVVGIYVDISATNTGGVADLYSIAPTINNNLSFSTETGVISGTPTAITVATYTVTASNVTGTDSATIKITVNPAAPDISLSTTTVVASVATAITAITVSNDGGTPTSYAISRSLSAGLSFSTETGTISGTPSATATATIYTVTATNITGTDSATIEITVNPQAPIIVFSPATVTVVVGIYVDISATNTDGVADLYSIAPAIANNLSFSTATGVISGTPTAVTVATYTVTASNVTGSSTATIKITVNPAAPKISLSAATVNAELDIAITNITVINNGGTPTSYAISDTLSAGLSFSTTTGTISGTPSATATAMIYTVTATNITGTDSSTVEISVSQIDSKPSIANIEDAQTYYAGVMISSVEFTNSGDPAQNCYSTNLPAGLVVALSGVHCAISGTPIVISATTTYTIIATNLQGSDTATINISVTFATPSISVSTTTVVASVAAAIADITVSNDGGTATYSISPALSEGLSFATNTGTISGTPSATATLQIYTITASNITNSDSATLSITVNIEVPNISLSTTTITATARSAISNITVTNSGGDATYSISPAIDNGLSFDTTDGTISGTPANAATNVVYTITASNASGNSTATLNITVNPAAPDISLSTTTVVASVATAITAITVSNDGGTATYSISPVLSEGLSFATNTGTISGTPSATATLQVYTITASNVTNSDSATLSITVNPAAPNIAFLPATVTAVVGIYVDISATNTGGVADLYSIAPTIANNLSFDTTDGTISGTPANVATNVVYTVTATNVTNSDSATLSITVNPAAPIISLSVSTLTATAGTAISNITVTNSGGDATYSISPAIDNALSFDTTDGTISGTPANVATNVVYTVTATNVTNSDSATLSITVNPAAPIISLSVSTLTATAGTAISNITVTNSGGDATYSISPAIDNGLSFDTTDGTISGTPANAATNVVWTITASNVSGNSTATLNITVNPAAPDISLSTTTVVASVATAITAITVSNDGGTATYSILPALSEGLSFATNTGTISGTPSTTATLQVYTITASNVTNSDSATLSITVNLAAPSIELSVDTVNAGIRAIDNITVINTGGTATYSISPAITNGLSFNTANGTISGTPSATATAIIYTVTATNISGTDSASVSITVSQVTIAPSIEDITNTQTYFVGVAISPVVFTNAGDLAQSCVSNPDLPAGLNAVVSGDSCAINGEAEATKTLTTYTITATNSFGSDTATINIAVTLAIPNISLSTTTITAIAGSAINNITVTNNGGDATYSISPAIDNGLSFDTADGTISGTPANAATNVVYTITASNVSGNSTATLNITVNPAAPDISLSTTTVVASVATAITAITVSNDGGTATYSISPTLSEGLSFATTDGTISGTPSATATLQVYTITASNVTNSDSATFSITVNTVVITFSLDVDGNQTLNATNDGLIIFKYLLNPDANNLHTTIANDAIEDRKTSAQLKAYLDNAGTILDVDGNQTLNATNDGLIIFKYLLNPDANNLHTTIANDAIESRKTSTQLKAYLDTYK